MVDLGRRLSLLGVLGTLASCMNATHRAQTLYIEGRLIEAAEVFEHGEEHLAEIGSKDRVRYGLYRGATLLKLGDLEGAARWLYFAQQAENHSPGSLEPMDAQTLRFAFKDLDRRRAMVKPSVNPWMGAVARASNGTEPLTPDVAAPIESSAGTAPTALHPIIAPGPSARP
jgi:hypothetical protein